MARVAETADQVAQLRDYLSEELDEADAHFAWRWLAACALCPVLRWPLTIALGNRLAAASGRAPPDGDLVLVLARLPWFRSGRMPDALRETLAATLGRADRRLAQAALAQAFEHALAEPGTPPSRAPRRSGPRIARLIERLPDSELADPLLAAGLRARPAGRRRWRIEAWRARLPRAVRAWTEAPRIAGVLAVAAALAGAATALPWLDALLAARAHPRPIIIDAMLLRLRACAAPPGYRGRPDFRPGALRLATALEMRRVAPGDGFAAALVAPNLSSVLTLDAAGDGTLWSLRGNGALSYARRDADPIELGEGPDGTDQLTRVGGTPVFIFTPRADPATTALRRPAGMVSFVSREKLALVASLEGGAVLIRRPSSGAVVKRIGGGGSPLLGIGKTVDGWLVIAHCDPRGRVMTAVVSPSSVTTPSAAVPPGKNPSRLASGGTRTTPRIVRLPRVGLPGVTGPVQQTAPPAAAGTPVTFTVRDGALSCAGCKLVPVPGFATRGRGFMAAVTSIMLHDTGDSRAGNAPSLDIITNGRPDLPGPLAQILIGRDGTIYQIASLARIAAHAGVSAAWNGVAIGNSRTIGIELEHDPRVPYPEAQLVSASALVEGLTKIYGIQTVVGHKEVALPAGRKTDPALDMAAFRKEVGMGGGSATPTLAPTGDNSPEERYREKNANAGKANNVPTVLPLGTAPSRPTSSKASPIS